jgi:hypothetical protein
VTTGRGRLVAVDAVIHRCEQLAADSVTIAIAEVARTSPDDLHVKVSIQYAIHLIKGVISAAEGHSLPKRSDLPLETVQLEPELIRKVSQTAAAAIWSTMVENSPDAERDLLLQLAKRVFMVSQEIQESALHLQAMPTSTGQTNLRRATAEALLRGEDVEDMARRANIRLASSYLVLMVNRRISAERRPLRPWPELERQRDVLAAPDGDELVILAPAMKGIHRVEVRAHAEDMLRIGSPEQLAPVVASVAAKNRMEIAEAVAEARAVLQVVQALEYPEGLYQVQDVPIEVSLMRSPDLADLLALRLMPLYGSGAPLLETLRVYLETSQDRRQAAAVLHVHTNTLDYRLRRIRELTGLSPMMPRDIQTLGAALMAWRLRSVPDVV